MRRFALLSFVVLAAPLAVAAQQPTAPQPAAPPPAVPHDSVRGAIRAIDVRASFGGYRSPFVAYTIERIGRVETGVEPTP